MDLFQLLGIFPRQLPSCAGCLHLHLAECKVVTRARCIQVLTGWDEGVDFTGEVTAIIGTPVFVAVSVLSGSFSSRFLGSCTHRSNMRWGEMAQVSDLETWGVRWHGPAHTGSPWAVLAQDCT